MPHWTEDVWVEQPELFVGQLESRFDQAPEQVDAVLSLLAAEYDLAPDSVLDVACGIGRHVVAFARAGVEATGVDISPDYVQQARERAHEAGVADATTVVERDMRDLREVSGRYDLVTSMFTSFGSWTTSARGTAGRSRSTCGCTRRSNWWRCWSGRGSGTSDCTRRSTPTNWHATRPEWCCSDGGDDSSTDR